MRYSIGLSRCVWGGRKRERGEERGERERICGNRTNRKMVD